MLKSRLNRDVQEKSRSAQQTASIYLEVQSPGFVAEGEV
jgi:hypothetical protein